jgi:hypothetical protein
VFDRRVIDSTKRYVGLGSLFEVRFDNLVGFVVVVRIVPNIHVVVSGILPWGIVRRCVRFLEYSDKSSPRLCPVWDVGVGLLVSGRYCDEKMLVVVKCHR